MNTHISALAKALLLLALFAAPSLAQEGAAPSTQEAAPSSAQEEEALKKDLTAVIALQGLPCGQVVTVEEKAESDYAVSCKDGNLYRVYLSAAGRVVVEKRT